MTKVVSLRGEKIDRVKQRIEHRAALSRLRSVLDRVVALPLEGKSVTLVFDSEVEAALCQKMIYALSRKTRREYERKVRQ